MNGCVILSIGRGGLAGRDDASQWLARTLVGHGLPVSARQIVDDKDESSLEASLRWALEQSPLVIVCVGQAGAGNEAIRRVLSRVTGNRLVLSQKLLESMASEYARRDEAMPRRAEKLALVPQGATIWPGTAGKPSFVVETPHAAVIVLPSSRESLATIVETQLPLYARERLNVKGVQLLRTFKVAGLEISEVEEQLGSDFKGTNWDVTCVAEDGDVLIQLQARGPTRSAAESALADGEAKIVGRVGDSVYGRDEEILEEAVARLLKDQQLTLSVAESCTGGLMAHRLTNVPGSSTYFERGVIAYSNQAKEELLGVPAELLRRHGAVSAPVAEAMARGIRKMSKASLGVAITGIAGPDGGTPTKPVGTVFVALASPEGTDAKRFRFRGDRQTIKWRSTQMALEMLRRHLKNVKNEK
ncbi:MAG TPA: nicotinamide-nucleotide amidohydrolase family protein [Methylomirabilota bacterium]|nr:nicotinamide-nucleotide amidohydrolase family protein [Methylomirabilota bacterium]